MYLREHSQALAGNSREIDFEMYKQLHYLCGCKKWSLRQPFKWLLSLPSNAPTIKSYKRLRIGLIRYDHLINAEINLALT